MDPLFLVERAVARLLLFLGTPEAERGLKRCGVLATYRF